MEGALGKGKSKGGNQGAGGPHGDLLSMAAGND